MTNHLMKKQQNKPKVSVLLPNLNNCDFLKERFQTILKQTFTDWELVVIDSYSDDGAWELIQEFAKKDCRIRISQAPREGIYSALNRCIGLAHGEYIYIATSDDTMTSNCLEQMVSALDNHSECDLAHCCLEVIDEHGVIIKDNTWNTWDQCKFFGDYIHQEHIRYAPHDGILYCTLGTLYVSLTQLLIKKETFEKIGYFKTSFSSMADFEWGLRASLVCNTVHVPHYLATWRRHLKQATQESYIFSAEGQQELCQMIASALQTLKNKNHQIAFELNYFVLSYYCRFNQLFAGFNQGKSRWKRVKYLLSFIFIHVGAVIKYIHFRITYKKINKIDLSKYLLRKFNIQNHLKLIN